ncbi:MAG: tetratricopeptide repeat protein, partial [Acidimicrobiia bacterium]
FVLGDFKRLRELAGELEAVLGRHGDRWYLMFTLAETSFAWAASGDWPEAFRRLDEARRLNVELGDRTNAAYGLTLQAWLERARGRYEEAVSLGRAAAAAAQEGRNTQWTAWSEVNLGAILAELGAFDQAVERLEEGRSAAERGARIQLLRAYAHLASVRTAMGDTAAEGDLAGAEALLAQVRTPPGTSFLYGLDAYLAVAGARLARGDPASATGLLAPLLAAAESAGWAEGVGRVALALGECAAVAGEPDEAVGLLTRAARLSASVGIPAVEWQAEGALAGLASMGGDRQMGGAHRQRARAVIDELAASLAGTELRRTFVVAAGERLERLNFTGRP